MDYHFNWNKYVKNGQEFARLICIIYLVRGIVFPEKNEITASNNRIIQQLNPSDGWLKAVSSERLKRDIDMLQKIVPSSKQFFVAHINYQKSSLILCICSKNRRLCVLMLSVLKGISRTLPNIYNVVFAKIVNGLQLLTICEKKLHYRCLTGF